jgi:metal-sulfur cluster biosynthetic enzyme
MYTKEQVIEALKKVNHPEKGSDIVSKIQRSISYVDQKQLCQGYKGCAGA